MNKIYRLKFDKRRNELVVVSEITAGMGKEKSTGHIADLSALSPFRKLLGTLTPLALLTGFIISLFPGMALAADLPTGGQIVGGQGSISTSGNQMTIHQQTQNMATNWHSFDVGQNNTVQFVQPDSSSVALNRVTGTSGSQIMGTLKANGQVFILNPNGVLFGKGARVNVAGLVASTKNINTEDFMKGQYTLSGSGTSGAQVINQGSLTTSKGGYIVLAGERVSNSGTVTTPGGKTVLAAGKTVTLQLDSGGLTSVSVNGSVVNALVENRGLISAANGQVYLTAKGKDMLLNTVVNNSGTIEAKGLESRGGEIVLNGGDSGVVRQSGKLLTDSQTGQGGKITLEGQNIHLAGSSLTSATGKTGGGEVYVGGGWQGKDSRIKNASKVVMDKTATVDVSARDAGNGGTAVLWSDDYTNFRGTVLAKGGAQSGNGGRVETSSHNNLQAFGDVNTSASSGKGGEWLLDPTNVTIVGEPESESGVKSSTDAGTDTFIPTASGAQILNTSIETQLEQGANVTIKTSGTDTAGQYGDIAVDVDITKKGGGDATLTLSADRSILVNTSDKGAGNITSKAGKLHINLLAGGTSDGTVVVGRQIDTNGGNFSIGGVTGMGGPALHKVAVRLKANSSVKAGNVSIAGASTKGIAAPGKEPENIGGIDFWGTIDATGNVIIKSSDQITISRNPQATSDAVKGNAVRIESDDSDSDKGITLRNAAIIATGGDVNIKSGSGVTAIRLERAVITASEKILLDGKSERNNADASGVNVNNSNLSAKSLDVKGVSTKQGTGFSLTNSHLKGKLADREGLALLTNVSLSSAGSAAGVINTLDSNIVNDSNRNVLLEKRIENMTTVDMGGHPIFDDTGKGWKKNYSLDGLPNHGWIFNNTSVTAGGDVELNGVGFTNSAVSISSGNLNIDNSGSVPLTGTTITLSDGAVNVHARAGNIKLNKSSISAKDDITLKADAGSIAVSGTSAKVKASITSTDGSIFVNANADKSGAVDGVFLGNTSLSAVHEINIKGTTGGQRSSDGVAGVKFQGDVSLTSMKNVVDGQSIAQAVWGETSGVSLYGETHVIFVGATTINAESESFSGLLFNAINLSESLEFRDGISSIHAIDRGNLPTDTGVEDLGGMAIDAWSGISQKIKFKVSNASLNIISKSMGAAKGGVMSYSISGDAPAQRSRGSGYIFTGQGNISIKGTSTGKGAGVDLRVLDNQGLDGKFVVNGESTGGVGVIVPEFADVNVINASIFGSSESGVGILLNSADSNAKVINLKGNALTGSSVSGSSGIQIEGNNVTIKNGSLKGSTTSGTGAGISLNGGSKYTLDGVTITGQSADGAGVSVGGALIVNNGTRVEGTSSASGAGVSVAGTLTTESGDGVTLEGQSDSGDGVQVAGETSLNNATVKGTSASGTGTNIKGPLTVSGTSEIKGTSTSGAGLNIAKKVTVNPPDQETVTFIGTSTEKAGVIISNSIDGGKVAGHSEKGTGVQLNSTGKVSDVILTATSVDGTGLRVEKGSEAEDVEISAQTVAGKAIAGENNALTATSTSISTVGEPGNTNISGNVKPAPGGTPSGVVAEALGNKLSESIAALQKTLDTKLADLDGLQQTMTALQMQFDQAVRTGAVGQADLKRLETLVNGLSDSLHIATVTVAELKGDVGALKTDTGSLEERLKTSDALSSGFQGLTLPAAGDISAVAGELSAAKALQSATVSLQGSLAARAEEEGVVRHLLDSLQQQLKDAQEKGTAGGTVLSGIQTQLESLGQQQRLYMEALARIRQGLATVSGDGSIPVAGRQESVNRLQAALSGVSGVSGIQVSELGRQLQRATTGYAQLVATVQQQGSVNAQTLLQSREQQDGFHAGGEPMVPVHGYQARPQNVDIHLCDGEGCRSVTLDAGKPSQGLMVASTESR